MKKSKLGIGWTFAFFVLLVLYWGAVLVQWAGCDGAFIETAVWYECIPTVR